MLVLARRVGEEIVIDEEIRVTITEVRGNRVQLGIVAPGSVPVRRTELRSRRRPVRAGLCESGPAQTGENLPETDDSTTSGPVVRYTGALR